MIDWPTIKSELRTVITTISGLPASQIRWMDESEGSSWTGDPRISLRVSTVKRQGIEEERWDPPVADANAGVTICGQRQFTLSLRCESNTQDISSPIFAGNVLDRIAIRIMRSTTRALITSFAIENRLGTTWINYKSDGRQVSCYVQDWALRTVDNDTDDSANAGGYINEVIADGTVGDADGVGGPVADHLDVTGD